MSERVKPYQSLVSLVNKKGEMMARINIEEEWFSDMRRGRLIELLGDKRQADGAAVEAWFLAFQFWKKKELIPEHAWIGAGMLNALFECGLAEKRPEGIYVRGASRHFDWYFKKLESASAGGKNSAKSRKLSLGTAQPPKNTSKHTRSTIEALSNNIEPSSSSSSSSSFPISKERRKNTLHTTSACAEACVLWKKLHQSRYNASIPWGAKENGQLSRLTKSVSKEDLILDIEFWFSWNEPFVVKTCHSLGLFIKTHAKVSTARQNPNVLIAERSNQRSYENTMNAMEVFHAPNNSALERRAAIDQQAEGINDDVPESSVLSNGLPSERRSEEDGEFLEYESHSKGDADSEFS